MLRMSKSLVLIGLYDYPAIVGSSVDGERQHILDIRRI